jgi:hypothetical protein
LYKENEENSKNIINIKSDDLVSSFCPAGDVTDFYIPGSDEKGQS